MKSNGEEAPIPPPYRSFLSLPEDIVLSCFARISPSYYAKLCLVSKSFRSLLFSNDLVNARKQLKTSEECVFLCLKLPTRYVPYWFSLYKTKNSGHLLAPMPFSHTLSKPTFYTPIGSEFYTFDGNTSAPSSVLLVSKTLDNQNWRKTPSMKVPRMGSLLIVGLNEKIYVMGGCQPSESTHWAEVFDVKTQTWKPLPDPGLELRNSSLRKISTLEGKLYVITDNKPYVYDPEQGIWNVTEIKLNPPMYTIDDVTYYTCWNKKVGLFDAKLQVWTEVKGLDMLDTYDKKDCIEIAYYGGKLGTFWESPNEGIWFVVITLERRGGEVWGQIESVDKLKVPNSSILFRCVVAIL